MELIEKHYAAERCVEDHFETLTVVQEIQVDRNFIRFSLMETRWRSIDEAASYLRWAADEIDRLSLQYPHLHLTEIVVEEDLGDE